MRMGVCLAKEQERLRSFERSNRSSTSCRKIVKEKNDILSVKSNLLKVDHG